MRFRHFASFSAIYRLCLCLMLEREEGWLLPVGWTVIKSHWCIVSLIPLFSLLMGAAEHGWKKVRKRVSVNLLWPVNTQEYCKILANWKYQMLLIALIPWEIFAFQHHIVPLHSRLNRSCRSLRTYLQALSPVWFLSTWGTCCVFLWMLLTSPSNKSPECHKNTHLEWTK